MGFPALFSRHASPLQRCLSLVVLVVLFVTAVNYFGLLPPTGFTSIDRLSHHRQRPPSVDTNESPSGQLEEEKDAEHDDTSSCDSELAHLRDLGLSRYIKYSRRCIKPIFATDTERASVTNISSTLLTNTTTINMDVICSTSLDDLPCEPLELPVPPADPPSHGQYSHLLFGIATSSKRLAESKDSFAHWLADSGATLICIITDEQPQDLRALEASYAAAGMTLKLATRHATHHTPEQSHLMIIRDLVAHTTTTTTRWLGILDDDTFIPSLHALSIALASHDPTISAYLGALTEDAHALGQGILAAWGGAGIFLSTPLARDLTPHLDACVADAAGSAGGDMLIMRCVHAHSAARLTRVPGLWQMDFMGDTAGMYESGRAMLTMHHWKSWHWLPAAAMAAVTRVCGGCFLARFVFAAGDAAGRQQQAVLNVGYSINMYTGGVPDLSRTEQTWDGEGDSAWRDFEWSVGPLRPKVGKEGGKKKTWWLKTVVNGVEDGGLRQVYLHEGRGEGVDDEVIELVWLP